MIVRSLAHRLRELATKMPAVAVLGPRQAGKSTLVRAVFPDYVYVSLEAPDTREMVEQDPRGFLAQAWKGKGIIIDEFQRVPQLLSYLQGYLDESPSPGFCILTGSQNYLMMESISQSLAGRVALLKLFPLSLDELKNESLLQAESSEIILNGLYPRAFVQRLSPKDWVASYIEQYVERDARQLLSIKDLSTFKRFITLCAGRVGQLLNVSALAVDAGINQATAKQWLSLLEASYIIMLIEPWFKNTSKRVIKSTKLYFVDTALACSLLRIDSLDSLKNHYAFGSLFENLIIMELLKARYNEGLQNNIYFLRGPRGEEVDAVLEFADHLKIIEIKSSQTIRSEYFKGLKFWSENLEDVEVKSFLVHDGPAQNLTAGENKIIAWTDAVQLAAERNA